jgi:hypothetical protein
VGRVADQDHAAAVPVRHRRHAFHRAHGHQGSGVGVGQQGLAGHVADVPVAESRQPLGGGDAGDLGGGERVGAREAGKPADAVVRQAPVADEGAAEGEVHGAWLGRHPAAGGVAAEAEDALVLGAGRVGVDEGADVERMPSAPISTSAVAVVPSAKVAVTPSGACSAVTSRLP